MGKTYRKEAPYKKDDFGKRHTDHNHERMDVKQKLIRDSGQWRELLDDDLGDADFDDDLWAD